LVSAIPWPVAAVAMVLIELSDQPRKLFRLSAVRPSDLFRGAPADTSLSGDETVGHCLGDHRWMHASASHTRAPETVETLFFLPSWPPQIGTLTIAALTLLVALIAGEVVQRVLKLPRLIGWVLAGVVLGPSVTGLLDAGAIVDLRFVLHVAAGLVLFEFGQRIDLGWLYRNPWLAGASVLEASLAFIAVFTLLILLGVPSVVAAFAAAIGMATSPATVLTLTRDLRASGQVTQRIELLTALDCAYAFITIGMLLAWFHAEYHGDWLLMAAHPIYLILGSTLLALFFAGLARPLLTRLDAWGDIQRLCAFALVLIAVAAGEWLNLSSALVLLGFGASLRALDDRRRFVSLDFGPLGQIFLVLLFALSAAALDLSIAVAGAVTGLGLVAARYVGKYAGVLLTSRASGLSTRKGSLVALGLMPMSAVALVFVHETVAVFPALGQALLGVLVPALVVLEMAGPLLARFAIVRAGESTVPA